MTDIRRACHLAVVVAALVLADFHVIQAARKPPVVDLTRGGQKDNKHDWNLGPTGARGWIWGWNLETTDSRQILITRVDKGSPADGVLQVGDVILGVDGRPFAADARKAFGRAITQAETEEHKGVLKLLRWPQDCKSYRVLADSLLSWNGTSVY